MSRNNSGGPKLPRQLLDQVSDGRIAKRSQQQSRKDRRKTERAQKRAKPLSQARAATKPPNSAPKASQSKPGSGGGSGESPPSIPKRAPSHPPAKPPLRSRVESESESQSQSQSEDEDSEDDYPRAPAVSKYAKAKLEEDDLEIARLEKKLGIKKSRKKVGDDELDWLVNGGRSDEDEDEDEDGFALSKRKRAAPEDDDWLKQKRRKASKAEESESDGQGDISRGGEHNDDTEDELENPFSEDELSEDGFDGFHDEDQPPKKPRENPYVAPVANDVAPAGKYIPPSLRKAVSSDEELLKQLRRQFQGQLNRLSEEKLVSILDAVVDIYTKNPRQHCTSVLVELFRDLICDPSVLNETFLILHAGFAAALHRTIGTDFGAQLLEAVVEAFDKHHEQQSEGKQTLNLLAFLSNLYTLQAIGCDIIFDYIKILLNDFSESNTELLLRVIRVSGQQLRQDDPTSLKDIVLLLQRSIASVGGEAKVSVRTKFMIETIHSLKNNRLKNAGLGAVAAEHMQRIKKKLGTIKNAKNTEPLRISLADIRDSEKKGKWWLVGASWKDPAKMVNSSAAKEDDEIQHKITDAGAGSDSDIDLDALARRQGMNTDVRRAIFISITGAVDPQHAFLRIQKLNLKNKQQLEIPRVLLHCVAAEPVYNHFYTVVACRFCGDRKLKKAYHFALLDVLRRCGEDAEDDDDEDVDDEMNIKQLYNTAKLYGTLIAEGHLRPTVLKPMRFAALKPKTGIFAEILLATVFILLRKKSKPDYEKNVKEAFTQLQEIPAIVKSLVWFLEDVLPKSDVAGNKKEMKVTRQGCEYAIEALRDERKLVVEEDEDEDEAGMEIEWD